MINDWMGLTTQVLGTIRTAHSRLLDDGITRQEAFAVDQLIGGLNTQQITVETILAGYEAGTWKAAVKEQEKQTFQSLVDGLSQQCDYIGSRDPVVLVKDLTHYVNEFLEFGPHGPGHGEPEVSSPEDAEDFGPDTHGSGEGEP